MLEYFRIDPERLQTAIQTIEREFGRDWLDKLSRNYKDGRRGAMATYHPIYHGILGGSVQHMTVETIELASYIDFVRKFVPGSERALVDIVSELKNPEKFYSYLFQLMVAVRFRLLTSPIEIEPRIEGRTPDLRADYFGTEFIIETTRPSASEKVKKLDDFLEKLFVWLWENTAAESWHLQIRPKKAELWHNEKNLKYRLRAFIQGADDKYSSDELEVEKVNYRGSVEDFYQQWQPEVARGTARAFSAGNTNNPIITDSGPRADLVPCRKSLVVDLRKILNELYISISDKIDRSLSEKIEQLKSLAGKEREIYVFICIDAILGSLPADPEKTINRIRRNAFGSKPGLLRGVVLANRFWDESRRRYQLSSTMLWAPGSTPIENLLLFRDFERMEATLDVLELPEPSG